MANTPFTVVTFNVRNRNAPDGPNHWSLRTSFVLDLLHELAPDVLCLQECYTDQVETLADGLPGYALVGTGRDDGAREGEWAAVFVREERFHVVETGSFWYSETPERPGTRSWDNSGCNRICSWARLREGESGGEGYVYNSHWDHEGPLARQWSARMLAERIAARSVPAAPVIVTGDFNATPNSPAVRYLTGRGELEIAADSLPSPRLVDAFAAGRAAGEMHEGTFHGFSGNPDGGRIDYILVSDGIDVLGSEIVRTSRDGRFPSDHFPVAARLALR